MIDADKMDIESERECHENGIATKRLFQSRDGVPSGNATKRMTWMSRGEFTDHYMFYTRRILDLQGDQRKLKATEPNGIWFSHAERRRSQSNKDLTPNASSFIPTSSWKFY